jgi:hypothetical protein
VFEGATVPMLVQGNVVCVEKICLHRFRCLHMEGTGSAQRYLQFTIYSLNACLNFAIYNACCITSYRLDELHRCKTGDHQDNMLSQMNRCTIDVRRQEAVYN